MIDLNIKRREGWEPQLVPTTERRKLENNCLFKKKLSISITL